MTYHSSRRRVAAVISIVTVAVLFYSTFAAAQDQPAPKWEVFAGYSYFDSCSNLRAIRPGATLPITVCLTPNKVGVGTSLTYNLNRWFGMTGDFSGHWHADAGPSGLQASRFYNVSLGPKLTLRRDHFAPFIEALVGWHRLSTDTFGSSDDVGFITGGGIDIPLTKHFGLRLAQADYVMSNHRFGTVATTPLTRVRGYRLQTGLKFMFGGEEAVAPVSATCSVQPTEVMAGEPVQASANASNFRPNHKLSYNWTSTGGQVSGQESTTTIATNGLAGGNYVVTARVSDPKMKKGGEASCSSNFTVRVPEPAKNPPTLSCSATPTTVRAGDAPTVTVTAGNPDNRQLT